MVSLKEIDFQEFERDVYKHYVELFPSSERQSKKTLGKLNKEGVVRFVKIMDECTNVGFLIYATIPNNSYVWLDYFAIFKEFQNKKYGSRSAQAFRKFFEGYDGVYGEFEKVGFGAGDDENKVRQRRAEFWMNAGFELLDIDLYLYGVVYSSCILKLRHTEIKNRKIVSTGFELYEAVMGKDEIQKNCRILTKE